MSLYELSTKSLKIIIKGQFYFSNKMSGMENDHKWVMPAIT